MLKEWIRIYFDLLEVLKIHLKKQDSNVENGALNNLTFMHLHCVAPRYGKYFFIAGHHKPHLYERTTGEQARSKGLVDQKDRADRIE